MGKDTAGHGPVHIDERFLMEWFEKGFKELCTLLAIHAKFATWLADHPREETP